MTLREPDRLREIKHWYALHLLPQRRLMEDIHWMVNRIEELESLVAAGNAAPTGHTHPNSLDAYGEPRTGVHS